MIQHWKGKLPDESKKEGIAREEGMQSLLTLVGNSSGTIKFSMPAGSVVFPAKDLAYSVQIE